MSRAFTVTDGTTPATPAIQSVTVSPETCVQGRSQLVTVTVNTVNVPDCYEYVYPNIGYSNKVNLELTDANGVLLNPLVYAAEGTIVGGTATFKLILPSTLAVGRYRLRATVDSSIIYSQFLRDTDTLTDYADYFVCENDLNITSFTVPGQVGESVIDPAAHHRIRHRRPDGRDDH